MTVVEVTSYLPGPDDACGQTVVYPWHVVSLDGAGRVVEFTETSETGPPPTPS